MKRNFLLSFIKFFYLVPYNFLFNLLLKRFRRTLGLSILIFFFCLTATVFTQTKDYQSNDFSIAALVKKVELKSKKTKVVAMNEYQSNFKRIVEFEGQNKKSIEVYEEYCLNNDKSLCRIVLIEKDGIPISASKIEKARKKVAKEFIKNNTADGKEDPFGYGISINSLWVDPLLYLRDCQISSFSETIVERRMTAFVRVNNCNINNEVAALRNQILYMSKTEAEIWIDKQDESIVQMRVYARKEFASASNPSNPIIITENVRMPDGHWLSSRTRLETIGNKGVFPNLKDNWEYDFFGYQHLIVNVDASKAVHL